MEQRWYNPTTRQVEQVIPPANDARAVQMLGGREKAVEVYYFLRGPAYRRSVQLAFQHTGEHFRDVDAGRMSPISLEVGDEE